MCHLCSGSRSTKRKESGSPYFVQIWSMWVFQVLQLSTLLLGISEAHGAGSASRKAGEVPMSQLRMLSRGLGHLLHGVGENVGRLERHGNLMVTKLDGATKTVDSLHKQSVQTGRTNKQVRKDLQILSAIRDRLWRAVRDLQKELEELEAEQEAMQQRMNRVLQKVKILTEPRSGGQTDFSYMKAFLDKQARCLAFLTHEVLARERVIDRHLQYIEHLEKQLSSGA
ncbi:uncharacterized protein LOC114444049 [Parambassis ranga]|uniref:Uncharacterized protein LOC114444049 n=1 Tax=Parambassis ranga TaxID=210632 RepID=A0A6P7JC49_9TELE|nr:uncharacterized protein LOC114444049 [Parambassis ranga]